VSSHEACPECGSRDLAFDEEHREIVCQDCGAVLDAVDVTLEPGVGPTGDGEGGEQEVPEGLESAQALADELSGSKRRAILVHQEIRRLATVLNCPDDVVDRARRLFASAREAEITRGRVLEAWAAACLLAACRQLHLPRTIETVAASSKAEQGEIRAAYDALKRELGLPVPPSTPMDYVSQLASELELPGPLRARAREVLGELSGTEQAGGKDPLGWAAAALVWAARGTEHAVSMNRAAQAGDVSDSTVKARLEDLDVILGA